ncbi:MAG: WYL domain-containing protein [Salinisphaera sp.]|uniref:helix-turn-helix transcriptional regulator n=1 Tax=Salinisphaera sp. TaxID=1914330 RepID=UPI003C7ED82D
MADTLFRQWTMLRHIPRQPRRIKTSELAARLIDEGFDITARTVERDLDKLSSAFGYTSDTEGRTNYWYWPTGFNAIDIPGLEPNTALAFNLAEQHLANLLPPATLDLLSPYFQRARAVLDADTRRPLHHWADKIRAVGSGPQLAAPTIDTRIQRAMYAALLHEKRVAIQYAPRGDGGLKDYEFSPLGLVSRDGVLYFVGPLWAYENVVQLALHRIQAITPLELNAHHPQGFDLDEYIKTEKGFSYPTGAGTIALEIEMDRHVAQHLAERPLGQDQEMTDTPEGRVSVAASVTDTDDLHWWLLGLGESIEVIKPARLRNRVIGALNQALAQYRA